MENLARILGEHSFFYGLPARYLDLMVGCAKNIRFGMGETILREGDPADWFYLIREGKVAVQTSAPGRSPVTLQTLGPEEILGWSWLVPPYLWRFDGRAVEPVRAIALDGSCLRRKCAEDHDLGYELLSRIAQVMARRLHATRLQALEVYTAWCDTVEGVSVVQSPSSAVGSRAA
jgi:CRP/FNR family cyclic AMP-dependent transcriptional regulator